MKWIASTIGTLLMLLAIGAAQQTSSNRNENDARPQGELRTVIGCLSRTANTYVITGGAPGPQQFRIIAGDTSMLKGKIGQTVRVVGKVGESDPVQPSAPPYNEGSTTGVTYKTIEAQKITVKGGLCSNPGEEYPGDHK